MTFCKVFFLYSDSVIEFRLQKSIYNYYSLKFVQRHGYKSQEWFKFLFVWWKKIPHSSRAAVVPKQTFLSTSRYFFKTHCVFLELLTPLFVDLSFCNSTPHRDHTGQISILKVHLEVFSLWSNLNWMDEKISVEISTTISNFESKRMA